MLFLRDRVVELSFVHEMRKGLASGKFSLVYCRRHSCPLHIRGFRTYSLHDLDRPTVPLHKEISMKCLFMYLLVHLTLISLTLAAERNTPIGTRTSTSVVNGLIQQLTETVPEQNPLPATFSALERERSVPLPHSNALNSYIRWMSPDAAAIGQDVAMDPTGEYEFIGWNLNNTRVSFHDNTSNIPGWEFLSDPNAYRNFVALSTGANIVANASYRNIYLFDKNTGTLTFNYALPTTLIAGPIAVSRDGTLLVCATVSALAGGTHRVYAFNPPSTTPIWTFDFPDAQSTGVYGVTISVDKATVAVNGKFYGWILNASNGSVRTEIEIANTESRLALSADASVMGIAENSGFIKAYNWNSGQNQYDLLWMYKVPAGSFTNWASSIDVSADGLTIMAGSLIFLSAGYDGSVYLFDTFGEGFPNWIYSGAGDLVDEIALSDDGSIGAAVSWGEFTNATPDILIFERASNTPVFSVNTPGSMFSLAMSPDGKSVIAGGKAVHARQFGNGGEVYNIGVDLGGGAIAGTVTLTGATNNGGATVQVLGTNRTSTTNTAGQYVVQNVPAGVHSVKMSKLGYISATVAGVTVVTFDTTENVNATLAQSGAAPSNLVASHSLNSIIQLNWSNPTSEAQRAFERLLAADDYVVTSPSLSRSVQGSSLQRVLYPPAGADLVPPDSVRIYRAIRTGGPYYLKRTISGSLTSYVDSTVLPLKNYYYRVTGVYGSGESVYSNEAYGTVDSSFLQFNITAPHRTTTPTIDGMLTVGEWTDALRVDVSDVFGNGGGVLLPRGSVFMSFKYDSVAQRLYIAGEDFLNTDGLSTSEGFGLYFDDNNNNHFEAPGTNPLLREGNYWCYYFSTGSTVRFREIYTNGGVTAIVDTVTDAQVAMSAATGHFVGEVSIPISFFNKNHLQVYGPDKKVGAGLFLINRNAGAAVFHGWWPQTMTSVFTPSGFGDIRIPINLLAPPKAPGNVALARQGNYLHLTWSDPTEGINNDPLTVPVTLELYKNDELLRTFATGVQSFVDTNVAAEGWYEYKLRGSIDVAASNTVYYGPFSTTVGEFAVSSPQLSEVIYDDGIPEVFYVVDFTYNDNKFGIRFTPAAYPAKVYRVKAFTNNGQSPILVSVHKDSSGLPGVMVAGPYVGESHQVSGIDSFLVTIPGTEPPTITSGDFWIVLSFLPTSPGAPGIGADATQPLNLRSWFYLGATGWSQLAGADLIVRAFITGQPLDVSDGAGLPAEFALSQNYPNPFNPSTTINYQLPISNHVSLRVYDLLGREVSTLVNETKEPGSYSVNLDAANLSSGVYFYKLSAGSVVLTKKLMVLR